MKKLTILEEWYKSLRAPALDTFITNTEVAGDDSMFFQDILDSPDTDWEAEFRKQIATASAQLEQENEALD